MSSISSFLHSMTMVTFGNEWRDAMVGTWPIEVKDHGTGYDAWVLDGRGRAAIGPAEFGIRNVIALAKRERGGWVEFRR